MAKYPFSQLIREIFLKMEGLRARLHRDYAPSEHNEAVSKNFLTPGDVNLGNFFVAPSLSMIYTSVVAPRNMAQIHNLQL